MDHDEKKQRPITQGKPWLPVLSFIVFCNELNETLCNTWAKSVRETTVQERVKMSRAQ